MRIFTFWLFQRFSFHLLSTPNLEDWYFMIHKSLLWGEFLKSYLVFLVTALQDLVNSRNVILLQAKIFR